MESLPCRFFNRQRFEVEVKSNHLAAIYNRFVTSFNKRGKYEL